MRFTFYLKKTKLFCFQLTSIALYLKPTPSEIIDCVAPSIIENNPS